MKIEDLIAEGFLAKVKPDKMLIEKEIQEAKYDLNRAKGAFQEKDFKWCIIKSYYSMFHSAKALLFSLGLKERRHFAIAIVLEELSREGKIESSFVYDFKAAMSAREDADYKYLYTSDKANYLLTIAGEFLLRIKKLISTNNVDWKRKIL